MWFKAFQIAQENLKRSGAKTQIEAEHILAQVNKIGQNQFQAQGFRQGILTIKATGADPVVLQADYLKIKNRLNKILNEQIIQKVRVVSS